MKVKCNLQKSIERTVINNLLYAQKRLAETGSSDENIKMAKFLFYAAKKFNYDVDQFCFEENEKSSYDPPNTGEDNIA